MESWHILPVRVIWPCDLDLWPIYTKIGPCYQNTMLKICVYFEVHRPLSFWSIINCRFCGPVARQPVLAWQAFCAPLVAWSSWCQPPSIKFIGPPSTETRRVLAVYTMCPCDLDLSHFDLGVMSRDATWAMNPCTKFELDTIYRSRVTTTIIFHWPPA